MEKSRSALLSLFYLGCKTHIVVVGICAGCFVLATLSVCLGQWPCALMQLPVCIEHIRLHGLFGQESFPCELSSINCTLSCPHFSFLILSSFCQNLWCLFLLRFLSLLPKSLNLVGNSDPGKGDISELSLLSLLHIHGVCSGASRRQSLGARS